MRKAKLLMSAVATLGVLFSAQSALADKESDTLRVAWGATGPIDNLDSYFNTNRTGIWLARHVWDTLVFRNLEEGTYEPLLAESWEFVDDKTIDFTLRQGVQFHNGEPFDADDVVYTFNFIADPDNGVLAQNNVKWIDRAEKIDQYKVRLHMKNPVPQVFEFLSGPLAIYPNEYYADVGPEGMNRQPIGTGPYKVDEIQPTERYRLSKNENYNWGSPKGEPKIGAIDIREIADVQTQVAELLAGGIDFTADITADQVENIRKVPGFDGAQAETMRISYLGFDAAGRSGFEPTQKEKVRQAIAHAVNRKALSESLVRGSSRVVNTPCFPTQFGCDETVATVWEYNPEKARALLAEAGYPDGFEIEIYNYRSSSWAEAIIGDLADIGITANLNQLGYFALRDLQHEGKTPLYLMDWGSYSINDMSAITSRFFTQGPDDFAMDDEVKAWLEAGDNSSDPEERQENYAKAIERITSRLYWLPMFSHVRNHGFVDDLNFVGFVDEIPRFYAYSWK